MNNYRYLTATKILPMEGTIPENAVLVFEDEWLMDIVPREKIDPVNIEIFHGTLIPGFINAHCHLELSHTKGKIEPGTGLTAFLQAVVTQDPVADDEILEAINEADIEMQKSGVVAVGDISNLPYTATTKTSSQINYYTFVEMFDFLDDNKADLYFKQYEDVFNHFQAQGQKRVTKVPHAPYTVSRKLMNQLTNSLPNGATGSIHMLENEQENRLMKGENSEYFEFFEGLGFGLHHFIPPRHGSLREFTESEYKPNRMLFVHNTVATKGDMDIFNRFNKKSSTFLVTCPNANLYIESRLPDYNVWKSSGLPICIGTDSYASNHQLSVWSEICTIQTHHESLSWEELIRWGTLHGAQGLGMVDELGSLEVGKKPGVVLLEHGTGEDIHPAIVPQRLI